MVCLCAVAGTFSKIKNMHNKTYTILRMVCPLKLKMGVSPSYANKKKVVGLRLCRGICLMKHDKQIITVDEILLCTLWLKVVYLSCRARVPSVA